MWDDLEIVMEYYYIAQFKELSVDVWNHNLWDEKPDIYLSWPCHTIDTVAFDEVIISFRKSL
jgi:hypothetical protein